MVQPSSNLGFAQNACLAFRLPVFSCMHGFVPYLILGFGSTHGMNLWVILGLFGMHVWHSEPWLGLWLCIWFMVLYGVTLGSLGLNQNACLASGFLVCSECMFGIRNLGLVYGFGFVWLV